MIFQFPVDENVDVKLEIDVRLRRLRRGCRVVGRRGRRHRSRRVDRTQLDRGETQLLGVAGKVRVSVVSELK